ncbi:bombesin receptor-activated protein C6orf89 homolog isoform X3 [Suricata suricatta]|uniref:bombesin receptor-activated protein C6orf89 homolog isoform X3 n=1 Tax=Suricata suricatta TaxID=37032 RepID=UPI0011553F9E|nr:bombesin receptor-activated protein C6orf89 homolog isoform X3 [Suricata suricatta]
MDFVWEDMDLAANELSIYDKLSETVDLVRQTGHQCGMSEKAIEKFIRQLLEKNEPQRGPPQYPLLIAVYKVLVTLGLILLTAYFVIQPFSPLPPEPVLSGAHPWRSLIHHIRLMSLPITKKYMPENKGIPLHGGDEDRPFPDFDPWWTSSCEQNESDPIPTNCTGCAQKLPLEVMLLEDTPKKLERLHPLVIKTGQLVFPEELQHFLCQYPEAAEGFTEGLFSKWWRCLPERWFPFPYPWRRPLNRSHILRELFPVFTYLPFPKDASLKKCFLLQPEPVVGSKMHRMHDLFIIGSGEAVLQLLPPFQCRRHCQSMAMPLEPGDIGVAGPCHSPAFPLLFAFKAMPVPPTGRSTLEPEGPSLWSSVTGPPSQSYRRRELTRGTTSRSEGQIGREEIKTETMKALSCPVRVFRACCMLKAVARAWPS